MIIIEGADLVGKTTFAKALLQRLEEHIYAHFTRLPCRWDYVWNYLQRASRHIVQDCFHLSEIVYPRVRGDESMLTPERYRLVDAALRWMGAYTVVITAEPDLIRQRWREGEMYKIDQVLKANQLFRGTREAFWEYEIDIDRRIHCTKTKPFPDSDDINYVLIQYDERQCQLDRILMDRPNDISFLR